MYERDIGTFTFRIVRSPQTESLQLNTTIPTVKILRAPYVAVVQCASRACSRVKQRSEHRQSTIWMSDNTNRSRHSLIVKCMTTSFSRRADTKPLIHQPKHLPVRCAYAAFSRQATTCIAQISSCHVCGGNQHRYIIGRRHVARDRIRTKIWFLK